MKNEGWTNHIVNIIVALLTTLLTVLYATSRIVLTQIILIFLFIFVVWLVFLNRDRIKRFLRFRIEIDHIERVLSRRTGIDDLAEFYVPVEEKGRLRNRLNACGWRQRPIVFMQIRVKHYLNWIDILYVQITRDLSDIGMDSVILIHDYPYEMDISDRVTVPHDSMDFRRDLEDMVDDLNKIAGPRSRVVLGSEFFNKQANSKRFPELFYRNFLPTLVNVRQLTSVFGRTDDALQLIDELRYLVGMLAVYLLRPSPVIFSLLWEARKEWWDIKSQVIGPLAESTFSLVGRTIKDENGVPIAVESHEDTINISDYDNVLERKVLNTDLPILIAICKVLLYPDEPIDWKTKSRDYVAEKVVQGVKEYRTRYQITPRN